MDELFGKVDLFGKLKVSGSLGNVLAGLGAYLGKSFMLYQPSKCAASPDSLQIPNESISARTSDGASISGYVLYSDKPEKKTFPTVVFFHENAGTLVARLPYFKSYLEAMDVNLVVFGYRGYWKSAGHPSYAGVKKDAEAIMDKLLKDYTAKLNLENIFLHGKSLGAGVAAHIASLPQFKAKVKGIVLDTPFASLPKLVTGYVPHIESAADLIFENEKWDVEETTTKFEPSVKVLLIGCKDDEICSFEQQEIIHKKLKESSTNPVQFEVFEDGGHNEYCYVHQTRYLAMLKQFFN